MIDMTDDDGPAGPAPKAVRAVGRKQMIGKLWRAAKLQLETHEAHLAELPAGQAASEADAKTLATLARTIRELLALDAAAAGRGGKPDHDLSPADGLRRLDELRRELARRMERLIAEETGGTVPEAAADPDAGAG
jgi:hypothetical protein